MASDAAERGRLRRAGRRSRYEALFPPWALAAAGSAIALAFLFQRDLSTRGLMLACFMAAAVASGKRISLAATVFVAAGIVAANLLVPVGKVLWTWGPIRITETALVDGIGKALTFEGLVYLSKASVLPGLRLPGRLGGIVASAFVYYDRIVEYRGSIRPVSLMRDIDELVARIWEESAAMAAPEGRSGSGTGLALLVAAVLASYVPLAWPLFG